MTQPWPTGPVYDPVPMLPPRPTSAEPADVPAEAPIPLAVEVYTACADCEDVQCVAARAGAAEICRLVGIDYATLPAEQRGHYETVAVHAMAAMSEVLLASGAAVEVAR